MGEIGEPRITDCKAGDNWTKVRRRLLLLLLLLCSGALGSCLLEDVARSSRRRCHKIVKSSQFR